MAITPLPTPPSTSDPSTFATKADALLSALPTFVTEANALQADVNASESLATSSAIDAVNAKNAAESFSNATKWVSGTTYGEGDVVWSPVNFKSYRRKTTGAGTTDPSLDTTNWSAVAYFDSEGADIASASTVDLTAATGNTVRITGTTPITAFTMNAGQQMELVAAGAFTLTYHATTMKINGGASYTCADGDRLRVFKDSSGIIYVNITKQTGDALVENYFYKADTQSVAFTKTGAGTVSIKAGTKVAVASTLQTFATDTAVTMPTLTAGTDYAIYACTDGVVIADASFTAPSGYTVGNSRQIGGFHYAPGGNAAAQAGGDTTPAINEYSLWDIKFRPACTDPRGMALVAGSFWADIYLLGVDYLTNGSSKYNVSIADGSAPPKRSTLYGGNGTTTYAVGNWWNLAEALRHCGKRPPTYSEFAAFAYGTTEATSSGGTDVPTTGVTGTGATNAWNKFTSKFGVIQASGCLWIWGDEFGGGAAAAAYTANTQGRGSTYQMENAVLLGGNWNEAANSGSRASAWNNSAANSIDSIGARGVSDHLCII